jgi:signal recognition particle receptor subunit beta
VDGIFFVVDSADKERLSIVQEVLMELVKNPVLRTREIPLIILANKQDLTPNAIEEDDLKRIVQLDTLKSLSKL